MRGVDHRGAGARGRGRRAWRSRGRRSPAGRAPSRRRCTSLLVRAVVDAEGAARDDRPARPRRAAPAPLAPTFSPFSLSLEEAVAADAAPRPGASSISSMRLCPARSTAAGRSPWRRCRPAPRRPRAGRWSPGSSNGRGTRRPRRDRRALEHAAEHLDHALRDAARIGMGRQRRVAADDLVAVVVDQHRLGEGAADVDADPVRFTLVHRGYGRKCSWPVPR